MAELLNRSVHAEIRLVVLHRCPRLLGSKVESIWFFSNGVHCYSHNEEGVIGRLQQANDWQRIS